VGGVRTFYEVHGEGEPLVLLHGWLRPSPGPCRFPHSPHATASTCPNGAATGARPTSLDR
jgi:hypothetical protein